MDLFLILVYTWRSITGTKRGTIDNYDDLEHTIRTRLLVCLTPTTPSTEHRPLLSPCALLPSDSFGRLYLTLNTTVPRPHVPSPSSVSCGNKTEFSRRRTRGSGSGIVVTVDTDVLRTGTSRLSVTGGSSAPRRLFVD